MDQLAAERARAAANSCEDSNMGVTGCSGGEGSEVKQEPQSPMSPQQMTDEASLMVTLDKNKESLKRKLMMRRSLNELVDQGIYPSPKTPLAFMEQKKNLERAKIGDTLRFKISHRPDRQQLVQQHILEDTKFNIDPSLHEKQRQLKKARLADSLNDKLSHRPGVLELVQGNILQTEGELHELIKGNDISLHELDGSLSFEFDGYSDAEYGPEDGRSSDDALSPDHTDDSNLSDISSPPVSRAPDLPTSFKSMHFSGIQFNHDSKVTLPLSTQSFTIPLQTTNMGGLTFTNGSFTPGTFMTPRSNVTVTTINNNKFMKNKKAKPKPTPKNKVIKFHEYKGPPNVIKSSSPVSIASTTTVIGNPSVAASIVPQTPPVVPGANHQETPYHILLQQQQLYLQWQLEFGQKNMNATVIVPAAQKEGQAAIQVSPSIPARVASSLAASGIDTSSVSVVSQAPTHTVFTVAPSSQGKAAPQAPLQQIRIASPVMLQVKPEPQVGQPQPQMDPTVTPVSSVGKTIKRPTVAVSASAPVKQYTSLEEMKVPELKAELKKRNLTVSGQKPKLIERLKPYADAILKAPVDKSPPVTSPGSSVMSPTGSLISSHSGSSPQTFSVMSPPSSVTSPQSLLMSSKPAILSRPGSVLSSSMLLPVVTSVTGMLTSLGSVQSTYSSLTSPGSAYSSVVTSPNSTGTSVLSRSVSVMSPVGSVIDEILCGNVESPLASIQSMQSAVSVSNMTLMPDDLSNPFSPPESPLMMEHLLTPLSPDLMDTHVHSPGNSHRQRSHTQNMLTNHHNHSHHSQMHNIAMSMEGSRPPSALSFSHHDEKLDIGMDIDLEASTSSGLTPASFSAVKPNSQKGPPGGSVGSPGNQYSQPLQVSVLRSQDDQQQMLNHIQQQLNILQEQQHNKQQQQQALSPTYQLSHEEMLRQQQEKIEKLQALLQESQRQLQLQQQQHEQLQKQQQQLLQQHQQQPAKSQLQQQHLLQQQQQSVQSQQQQQQQQQSLQSQQQQQQQQSLQSQQQQQQQQSVQSQQQQLRGKAQSLLQKPDLRGPAFSQPLHGQPEVHMPTQVSKASTYESSAPHTVGVSNRGTMGLGQMSVSQPVTVSAPSQHQKPSSQGQTHTTATPQVIFSVPNGVKAPLLANQSTNMKQIQIPASWLTNIQTTPQGLSAVIVPKPATKKTKAPSLEFIKHQSINQKVDLVGGKSLLAVSTTGAAPTFIIAPGVPVSKTTSTAPTSTTSAQPSNGLCKLGGQKMTVSLPTSPVEGPSHVNVNRTSSNPYFLKEPPKYDDAVRTKQSKVPDGGTSGGQVKSSTMDDVLEILIRTGELPASAAQEPPPTPKTTTQSTSASTMSASQSRGMSAPSLLAYNQTSAPHMQSSMFGDHYQMNSMSCGNFEHGDQYTEMKSGMEGMFSQYESSPSDLRDSVKLEVKNEPASPQTTVNVYPPVEDSDSNDLFDLNEVMNGDINGDFNAMDWTPDPDFGDLDLADTDTAGFSSAMDTKTSEHSSLTIPLVQSPQRSVQGSEPDLSNMGMGDMDSHTSMQIDVPDWLDVIMPSTGFTPISAFAPMSFPADPILTPQTQKEVLDLFNFDESDLNTPSDLNCGSMWDKLTETTT
ncbi:nuclear factor of activated T-cells 5-like isoform X1 [Dreissena polymorpha]|nr:nuclear factor of activated T-cells 5-like isoform X1 [Dreissena polymorpha]